MITDVILGFEAQTVAQRHVGTNPPIILHVKASINICDT